MCKAPVLYCDDDTEIELPFKWAICSACDGHGKSSAYLGAFTQSEMDEQGPDFFDEYMAGGYDRTCDGCDGLGRVKVADPKRMPIKQRLAYARQLADDAEIDAIHDAERRMGA
jgi:hypothetical protein